MSFLMRDTPITPQYPTIDTSSIAETGAVAVECHQFVRKLTIPKTKSLRETEPKEYRAKYLQTA
jgi:hypothetical protein